MLKRDDCIFCSFPRNSLRSCAAMIAPFISHYAIAENDRNEIVRLLFCPRCSGCFFDHAYTDEEMKNLYHEYRSENYKHIRENFEPGYAQINDHIGASKEEVASRLENLERVIQQVTTQLDTKLSSILDWGGDRGQFIPNIPGVSRYIYELSDKSPIEKSILKLNSVDSTMKFDLIMSCHVFEHIASPVDELLKLRQHLNDGGLVYLEMPYEFPKLSLLFDRLRSLRGKQALSVMHEHVNTYSLSACIRLASRANLEVVHLSLPAVHTAVGRRYIISLMLRQPKSREIQHYGRQRLLIKENYLTYSAFLKLCVSRLT